MNNNDKAYAKIQQRIKSAYEDKQAINITAGNTKAFYGGAPKGNDLSLSDNQGIIEYDPAELVMVVRSGTSLQEVVEALEEQGQILGFEPPFATAGASIGGAVACGLSGAARPYRGGVRDYLLGTKMINGRAEICQFGGKVMKNVAGFDLFRPMAGAMGTLGVLLEVSIRLVPKTETEKTLRFIPDQPKTMITLAGELGKTLPSLNAFCWHEAAPEEACYLRLSGSKAAVKRDEKLIQKHGSILPADAEIWNEISEFKHPFFTEGSFKTTALVNVLPSTVGLGFEAEQWVDWGGGRRFVKTDLNIDAVRDNLASAGANVTALRGADRRDAFQPLPKALMAVHTKFKQAFDPHAIFNPGRMYPDL